MGKIDLSKLEVGQRIIIIYHDHNFPKVKVEIGTIKELNENGMYVEDTVELNPIASKYIKFEGDKPWCGSWIPWDGYARILTVIDKSTEEILYSKDWSEPEIKTFFEERRKEVR